MSRFVLGAIISGVAGAIATKLMDLSPWLLELLGAVGIWIFGEEALLKDLREEEYCAFELWGGLFLGLSIGIISVYCLYFKYDFHNNSRYENILFRVAPYIGFFLFGSTTLYAAGLIHLSS